MVILRNFISTFFGGDFVFRFVWGAYQNIQIKAFKDHGEFGECGADGLRQLLPPWQAALASIGAAARHAGAAQQSRTLTTSQASAPS